MKCLPYGFMGCPAGAHGEEKDVSKVCTIKANWFLGLWSSGSCCRALLRGTTSEGWLHCLPESQHPLSGSFLQLIPWPPVPASANATEAAVLRGMAFGTWTEGTGGQDKAITQRCSLQLPPGTTQPRTLGVCSRSAVHLLCSFVQVSGKPPSPETPRPCMLAGLLLRPTESPRTASLVPTQPYLLELYVLEHLLDGAHWPWNAFFCL